MTCIERSAKLLEEARELGLACSGIQQIMSQSAVCNNRQNIARAGSVAIRGYGIEIAGAERS